MDFPAVWLPMWTEFPPKDPQRLIFETNTQTLEPQQHRNKSWGNIESQGLFFLTLFHVSHLGIVLTGSTHQSALEAERFNHRNVIRDVQRDSFWHAISREAGLASLWPLLITRQHVVICMREFSSSCAFFCMSAVAPPAIVLWWEVNSALWSGGGLDSCCGCCRPPGVYIWTPLPHLPHLPLLQRDEIQTSWRWRSRAR